MLKAHKAQDNPCSLIQTTCGYYGQPQGSSRGQRAKCMCHGNCPRLSTDEIQKSYAKGSAERQGLINAVNVMKKNGPSQVTLVIAGKSVSLVRISGQPDPD